MLGDLLWTLRRQLAHPMGLGLRRRPHRQKVSEVKCARFHTRTPDGSCQLPYTAHTHICALSGISGWKVGGESVIRQFVSLLDLSVVGNSSETGRR